MDIRRLVETWSPGLRCAATGYLIADRLVLTARHAVADREDFRALAVGEIRLFDPARKTHWMAAQCVWPYGPPGNRADSSSDMALLRIVDPRWQPPMLPPVRWGRVLGGDGDLTCCAVAFPKAEVRPDGISVTKDITGHIERHTGIGTGLLTVHVDASAVPSRDELAWSGASGAAVFCGPLLTGVLIDDLRANYAGDALRATAIAPFLESGDFAALLRGESAAVRLEDIGDPLTSTSASNALVPHAPRTPAVSSSALTSEFEQLPLQGVRVRDAQDPYLWGVHRARFGGESALTPHIERDIDATLSTRIRAATVNGGAVLVVGPSTAGKTRSAFEAMQAVVPDRTLVAPPSTTGGVSKIVEFMGRSPEIARECVVWLDNIQEYVTTGGLTPADLRTLVLAGTLVLGTLREDHYLAVSPLDAEPGTSASRLVRESRTRLSGQLLDMMNAVRLDRLWSETELARASDSVDRRIQEALPQARARNHGVAEYITAAPALLSEWQAARSSPSAGHIRGAALVQAAADCIRCGLYQPVPKQLIIDLHLRYLTRWRVSMHEVEPLEDAWNWATELRYGATRLLCPLHQSTTHAFDYLPGALDREGVELPEDTLACIADHVTITAATAVGYAAYERHHLSLAKRLWTSAANTGGGMDALDGLAVLAEKEGDFARAKQMWQEAAQAGVANAAYNLALHLLEHNRAAEAESWLITAADAGHRRASHKIGHLLFDQYRFAESRAWWSRLASERDMHGAAHYGHFLLVEGSYDEAAELLRKTALSGDCLGAIGMARMALTGYADRREAAALLRDFAEAEVGARFLLGAIAALQSEREEAAHWADRLSETGNMKQASIIRDVCAAPADRPLPLRTQLMLGNASGLDLTGPDRVLDLRARSDSGDQYATFELASALFVDDAVAEAEQLWLRLTRRNHPPSAQILASLYREQDRMEESEFQLATLAFRMASAAAELAEMLVHQGYWREAEPWLRWAVRSGASEAIFLLGLASIRLGRISEAELVFRSGLETESGIACSYGLGMLLVRQGRVTEAEECFRSVYRLHESCWAEYTSLVEGRGGLAEVVEIFANRELPEGESAKDVIAYAKALLRLGRVDEAVARLLTVADHDPEAARALGLTLIGQGRLRQGGTWLRKSCAGDIQSMNAATAYGLFLTWQGKGDQARVWLEPAAEIHDSIVDRHLLPSPRDGIGFERWWELAAADQPRPVGREFGFYLEWQGRAADARDWLRRAADAGDLLAASSLAVEALFQGRIDDAEELFTTCAEAGDGDAAYELAVLVGRQGRSDEAQDWYRRAVECGKEDDEGWIIHTPTRQVVRPGPEFGFPD